MTPANSKAPTPVPDPHRPNTKGAKAKSQVATPSLTHINITQVSYAAAAAATANKLQPNPVPHANQPLPLITEVTVIRQGGHLNTQMEQQIQAGPPDTIVREVSLNMSKMVVNPIPL